ncbi:hypothetical protein IQ252_26590 [Tychonema sp. LEGE 07203]|nr:hypothetical protein [Tychonema sp. LEGE 07203]
MRYSPARLGNPDAGFISNPLFIGMIQIYILSLCTLCSLRFNHLTMQPETRSNSNVRLRPFGVWDEQQQTVPGLSKKFYFDILDIYQPARTEQ